MDDVIEEIRSLLNAASLGYKKIFYGEDLLAPLASFPFIEVIPTVSDITNRGTGGMKNNEYSITINFKHHIKKFYKADTDREVIQHMQDLVKAMEERNADGTFKTGTIMKVLSDNLQLSNLVDINGDWNISYDKIEYRENPILIATLTFMASVITPH